MPVPTDCKVQVIILYRLQVFSGKRYFRDFLASPEKIASNILADRLKTLEASGIVSRRPDPANARKIIYELTEKGADLIPALLELGHWGAKYDAKTGAPGLFVRRIEKDREGFVAELKSSLKTAKMRGP